MDFRRGHILRIIVEDTEVLSTFTPSNFAKSLSSYVLHRSVKECESQCGICHLYQAELCVCLKDSSHRLHAKCLQEMLDCSATDICILKCPNCVQLSEISIRMLNDLVSAKLIAAPPALNMRLSKRQAIDKLKPYQVLT